LGTGGVERNIKEAKKGLGRRGSGCTWLYGGGESLEPAPEAANCGKRRDRFGEGTTRRRKKERKGAKGVREGQKKRAVIIGIHATLCIQERATLRTLMRRKERGGLSKERQGKKKIAQKL